MREMQSYAISLEEPTFSLFLPEGARVKGVCHSYSGQPFLRVDQHAERDPMQRDFELHVDHEQVSGKYVDSFVAPFAGHPHAMVSLYEVSGDIETTQALARAVADLGLGSER